MRLVPGYDILSMPARIRGKNEPGEEYFFHPARVEPEKSPFRFHKRVCLGSIEAQNKTPVRLYCETIRLLFLTMHNNHRRLTLTDLK